MSKQLVLGGARSGKSVHAEQLALADAELNNKSLWYVATAADYSECSDDSCNKKNSSKKAGSKDTESKEERSKKPDSEMKARIELHQQRRNEQWQLIEEPLHLAEVINRYNTADHCLLIDCLTLWLTNALIADCWLDVRDAFVQALIKSNASIYIVSNEVGSGVVPLGELSRQFVDESGALHQMLATHCDHVSLVVAGLPLVLKSSVDE